MTAASAGPWARRCSLYGAGTIVGAGIYVLIGEVTGVAGFWAPLAFLVAALVAGVTGFVYAELASRQPLAGGPVAYSNAAFGLTWLATGIGWAIIATGLVSASTIVAGFAGYLGIYVDIPGWIAIAAVTIALGTIALVGVRQSAWFMAITTTAGVVGLLLVIVAAAGDVTELPARYAEAPPLSDPATVSGVLAAAFLAFFAFIGFEDLVHMSEEARRPRRDLPIAIVVALGVSALLYVLTSVATLILVDPADLAGANAPLVTALEAAGWPSWPLAVLGLLVIVNGALAQIVMATRVAFSLSRSGGAPGWLGRVNQRTATPVTATVAATIIIITLASLVPLGSLAAATSLIMLSVFFVSNLSLIALDRRRPAKAFNVPAWVPYLGATLCVALAAGQFLVPGGGG